MPSKKSKSKSGKKKKVASPSRLLPPEVWSQIVQEVYNLDDLNDEDDHDADEDDEEEDADEATRRLFEQFVLRDSGTLNSLSESQVVSKLSQLQKSGKLSNVLAEFEAKVKLDKEKRNDRHRFEEWGEHRYQTVEALSRTSKVLYELCAPVLWKSIDLSNKGNIDLLYLHQVILPRHHSHITSLLNLDLSSFSSRPNVPTYLTDALSLPAQSLLPTSASSTITSDTKTNAATTKSEEEKKRADIILLEAELVPTPPSQPPSSQSSTTRQRLLYEAQVTTYLQQKAQIVSKVIRDLPELKKVQIVLGEEVGGGEWEVGLKGIKEALKEAHERGGVTDIDFDLAEEYDEDEEEEGKTIPWISERLLVEFIGDLMKLEKIEINLDLVRPIFDLDSRTIPRNATSINPSTSYLPFFRLLADMKELKELILTSSGSGGKVQVMLSEKYYGGREEGLEWKGKLEKLILRNVTSPRSKKKDLRGFLRGFEGSLKEFELTEDDDGRITEVEEDEDADATISPSFDKLTSLDLSTPRASFLLSIFSSTSPSLTSIRISLSKPSTENFADLSAFLQKHESTLKEVIVDLTMAGEMRVEERDRESLEKWAEVMDVELFWIEDEEEEEEEEEFEVDEEDEWEEEGGEGEDEVE